MHASNSDFRRGQHQWLKFREKGFDIYLPEKRKTLFLFWGVRLGYSDLKEAEERREAGRVAQVYSLPAK